MSTNNVRILGLDKLKREFTGLNWKSTKIKKKIQQAIARGAKPNRNNVRAAIRGTSRFSRSAASRFARTYGFNKVGLNSNNFGVTLSPRLAGKPRRRGADIRTSDGKDMRFIINFHARHINMPNPDNYNIIKEQSDFIANLWRKGQLK